MGRREDEGWKVLARAISSNIFILKGGLTPVRHHLLEREANMK